MSQRQSCFLGIVVAGAMLHASAHADAPSTPAAPTVATQAPEETLAAHLQRGDRARRAARWSDAAAAYGAALDAASRAGLSTAKRAAIAGELGLCELALGKYRDAAEHLHPSVEHDEAMTSDQDARFEAGRRKAEAETAVLYLGVSPPEAAVRIGGKPLGPPENDGYRVVLDPGTYYIHAELEGYAEAYSMITAKRGSNVILRMMLHHPPAPSPPAEIVAREPTKAPSPAPVVPSAPVAVSAPCASPRACEEATATGLRRAGLVVASTGVLAGAALLVSAASLDGEVQDRAAALERRHGDGPCLGRASTAECGELRDAAETRNVLADVGLASLIAGGAIGALTASSLWWAPASPRQGARVLPATVGKEPGLVGVRVLPATVGKEPGLVVKAVW